MSKRIFSDIQQQALSKNINVLNVSDKSITFHPSFKLAAVKAYHNGKAPMEFFRECGFDISMIGKRNPVNTLARWRKIYDRLGEDGLINELRGNNLYTNVSQDELSDTDKLKRADAKISYLEAKLEFLKKLEMLERQVIN